MHSLLMRRYGFVILILTLIDVLLTQLRQLFTTLRESCAVNPSLTKRERVTSEPHKLKY